MATTGHVAEKLDRVERAAAYTAPPMNLMNWSAGACTHVRVNEASITFNHHCALEIDLSLWQIGQAKMNNIMYVHKHK